MSINVATANEVLIKKCEIYWEQLASVEKSYGNILTKWLNHKEECGKTGVYEYRLSGIYERMGKDDDARSVIEDGLRLETPYSYYLNASKLFLQFKYYASVNESKIEKYNKVIEGFNVLINQKPEIETAYEQLANIELALDKVEDAKKHALKALAINPNSWISMRILVVAYGLEGSYKNGRIYITRAITINEALMSDVDFMIAAAWTYAKLNETETAEAVLKGLYERVPAVSSYKGFKDVVKYLNLK